MDIRKLKKINTKKSLIKILNDLEFLLKLQK